MVKDLHYIFRKVLIGVGIALILSALRGKLFLKANAQVLYYRLYDSDYNLMYESDGTYSMNGTVSPVRYARVIFDDSIVSNHTYSLSSQFGLAAGIDYAWLYWNNNSSGVNVNGSYISSSPSSASTSNQQQTGSTTYYKQSNLMFDFTPTVSASSDWFLQLDFGSGRELRFFDLLNYSLIDSGVNNNQDLINQTNNIINNQNINNQNVINNQNQNTQDIINNQNQNSEKEIESQKVCNIVDKSYIDLTDKALRSDGTYYISGVSQWGVTNYIKISSSTIEKLSTEGNNYSSCWYDENKNLISCFTNGSTPLGNISVPSNAYYIRFSIYSYTNKPQYKLCTNGNQALQDSLTDDSSVGNSDISDLFDDISGSSTTPISDLLTLPITLLQAYLSGFESTCSPISLGSLYGTNIVMPCINIPDYIGSSLWSIIDSLFALYMIYNIAMMCVSIYESITSLDDTMQLLYTPQHANSRMAQRGGTYDG